MQGRREEGGNFSYGQWGTERMVKSSWVTIPVSRKLPTKQPPGTEEHQIDVRKRG